MSGERVERHRGRGNERSKRGKKSTRLMKWTETGAELNAKRRRRKEYGVVGKSVILRSDCTQQGRLGV